MSSLSIAASAAAASLRLQLPTNNAANTADTRRPPPNANASSTAAAPARVDQVTLTGGATTAAVNPFSPGNVTRLQPTAPAANTNGPAATPNVNPASHPVQQITASNAAAANSKAIQAGSNRIGSFLDINV
jgi:flagellar basal body rod protein FlgC